MSKGTIGEKMSDFRKNSHHGKKSFSGNKDFSNREMHKAKCTDCGCDCEVPFKPTPGKPVRCRDCFRKKKTY